MNLADVRAAGAAEMATQLGFGVKGKGILACPACHTERRSARDPRPPIGITANGIGWRCFACGATGDALSLAAFAVTGVKKPDTTGWKRVLKALDRGEGFDILGASRRREERQRDEEDNARRKSKVAASYWLRSSAAMDTIVEFYLHSRRIQLVPPPCTLRLLDNMMIARVVNVEGRGVAIHRTSLPPGGI